MRNILFIVCLYGFSIWTHAAPILSSTLSDTGSGLFDDFGSSVALNDDFSLVGAPGNSSQTGEACLFKRSTSDWDFDSCLSFYSSNGSTIKQFGYTVALSDTHAMVTAIQQGSGRSGVVFIFKQSGDDWVQEAEIINSDLLANDEFGSAISLSEDYAIIGSQGMGAGHEGAVYIYRYDGMNSWDLETTIVPESDNKSAYFGASLDFSDNYLIIGDYEHGRNKEGYAVIYYVDVEDGIWTKQEKLVGGLNTRSSFYAQSVAISNEYAAVGAPQENDPNIKKNRNSGAVYVYQRSLTHWTPQVKLTAEESVKNELFGSSVAIYDDYLLIGATGNSNNTGVAYLYQLINEYWTQVAILSLVDAASRDFYSDVVALSKDYAVVGAYNKNTDLSVNGSAYVYDLNRDTALTQSEESINDLVTLLIETTEPDDAVEVDSDGDGLSNIDEITILGTDPNSADSDNDGLTDQEETFIYQSDPLLADTDSDGLSDLSEVITYNSDPLSSDSDNDGYSDLTEVSLLNTDPALVDSDADGYTDEQEINETNTNPSLADTDGDGLSDSQEIMLYQTDPQMADSDQDGFSDGNEVSVYETDPLDINEVPIATSTSTSYSPSAEEDGTMAFEDQWPLKGDYDFNDAVVSYSIEETKQDGLVKNIIFKVLPVARGARYENSLRLLLNVPVSNVASIVTKSRGVVSNVDPIADGNQTLLILIDSMTTELPSPPGFKMTNTLTGSKKINGHLFTVEIEFNYPVDPVVLGAPPYNTFIARYLDNGELIEVHFPGFKPSKKASRRQFGRLNDDTNSSDDKYYQSDDNLPWAMQMPAQWHHPKERVDLSNSYPDILNWASSKGKKNKNWYKSKRKGQFIFEDVPDI